MPDRSVSLIIVDPPYGMTKCRWDKTALDMRPIWPEVDRILKPGGTIIIFGLGRFSASVIRSNPGKFRFKLIWEKTQPVGGLNSKLQPMRAHEDMMVFFQKTPTFHPEALSRYPEAVPGATCTRQAFLPSLLLFKKDSQTCSLHSTQKPLRLLQLLIEIFSNPGDTVLDFTMGSASTGVAALLTRRVFIGIEMDRPYFRIASARLRYAAKHHAEIPRDFAKVLKATLRSRNSK